MSPASLLELDSDNRPLLRVVAAVVWNKQGEYLLSSRPEGKAYAGYWEFAGGKVEVDETPFEAIQRELAEELGITITQATPWLHKIHSYEHAKVHLQFFRVEAEQWHGSIEAKEGQNWAWQKPGQENVSPMLPANGPILAALAVPTELYGHLTTGLWGENGAGRYLVAPVNLAEPNHQHILLQPKQWQKNDPYPAAESIWLVVDSMADWLKVQDADVVVWHVQTASSAAELKQILAEGVAMPLVVYAEKPWHHQVSEWLAAGAHTVILAQEESLA